MLSTLLDLDLEHSSSQLESLNTVQLLDYSLDGWQRTQLDTVDSVALECQP
ncbi:hypothetical protein D3C80_2089340 [compost metagenome]